jgi:hypothetical protein
LAYAGPLDTDPNGEDDDEDGEEEDEEGCEGFREECKDEKEAGAGQAPAQSPHGAQGWSRARPWAAAKAKVEA